MEKSTKIWIGVGIGALLALIAGITISKRNKRKKADEEAKTAEEKEKISPPKPPVSANIKTTGISFPIQRGSDGFGVKVVQAFYNTFCSGALKREEVYPLTVDGKWGEKTDIAAKSCGEFNRTIKADKVMYERMYARLENVNLLPK